MARKRTKLKVAKPKATHELVVRVETQDRPSLDDIVQPMKDGKELSITKTWVSERQIMRMVQQTPREFIYHRPAKGGGTWAYVTGSYVEKVLNFVFGFMWDFEIVEHGVQGETVWVKGRLTVKDPKGHMITKMQFGRADIKYKRNSKDMLDFGNDLKSASTDALKKCSSLLGIASDVYGRTEYKQETGNDVRTKIDDHLDQKVEYDVRKVEYTEPEIPDEADMEKKDTIRMLMGDIGHRSPKMSDVEKQTGLKMVKANYDKIIEKLKKISPLENLGGEQ